MSPATTSTLKMYIQAKQTEIRCLTTLKNDPKYYRNERARLIENINAIAAKVARLDFDKRTAEERILAAQEEIQSARKKVAAIQGNVPKMQRFKKLLEQCKAEGLDLSEIITS